jgi:enoyl-CoA hydratase/carnithine racemase
MTADDVVVVENRESVLWARLNRPDALNALDENVLDALDGVLSRADEDPSIRAIVLTGTGRAFSVGLDIDCLTRGFSDHQYFRHLLGRVNGLLLTIEQSPVPVIAAVNGLARAGGFEILLASDLAVAATDAQIGDNHLSFSVMPGGGATQRLPRRIGMMAAKELIWSARWLDGRQAAELGLVLDHVEGADLAATVQRLALSLCNTSRHCLTGTKRAMNEGLSLATAEGVALETHLFFEYLEAYPDASERFNRYLASRDREHRSDLDNRPLRESPSPSTPGPTSNKEP